MPHLYSKSDFLRFDSEVMFQCIGISDFFCENDVHKLLLMRLEHRQKGGIEPLLVSKSQELRSCPSTSPIHPGIISFAKNFLLGTVVFSCSTPLHII